MVRFIARLIGVWLVAAALVAAVVDAAKAIAASALVATPLGQVWFEVAPESLAAAQEAVAVRLGAPWLWQAITAWILSAPAWLVFVLLGALLLRLGRPRRRRGVAEEDELYV
nr:hypothetical protein [Propylenella binzhouense]